MNPPTTTIVVAGERFVRLTVIGMAASRHSRRYVHVKCDCGVTKEVEIHALARGYHVSCGCFNREQRAANGRATRRHGLNKTNEHRIWSQAKQRCYNPNNAKFRLYGARGITMCDRWRDSFENFIADMGPKPTPQHSIDRINNDGPYAPDNCRWATSKEQRANQTRKAS